MVVTFKKLGGVFNLMIKLENISKSFKKTQVLNDISFEIEKGEFVVLIGPSGCGKHNFKDD